VITEKKMCLFLVKGSMDPVAVKGMKLGDILLEEKPLFSSDDVVQYDVASHSFTLTDKAHDKVRAVEVPMRGRPFVVTVGVRRIYAGAFWSVYSSHPWDGIAIMRPSRDKRTELQITLPSSLLQDPRNDPELLEILKARSRPKPTK
jgi:hypothetical protein